MDAEGVEEKCVENDQFIRDPYNCTVFYQCYNGLAVQKACAAKLCFNIKTKLCDYCKNVRECTCFRTTGTTEGPSNEEFLPCPFGLNTSIFLSHPKDCGKFYFCKVNASCGDLGICVEGLWFNVMNAKCVEPWDDTCYLNKS